MRSKTFKKPRHLEGKAAKVRGCFVQLLCVLCALCGKRFRGPVWLARGVGFGDSGFGMGLQVAQESSLRSGEEMAFRMATPIVREARRRRRGQSDYQDAASEPS